MVTRVGWMVLLLLAVSPVVWAEGTLPPVTIVETTDFEALGREAKRRNLPILLMFSADHCPYCVRVKEEFLKPMLRSGDYDDRVVIRRIELGVYDRIRDFDGSEIYRADLSGRYSIWVTPTLVYLDHTGKQLAEKMVGLTTPDFYGGYIDMAIETARDKLTDKRWTVCRDPRPELCTMEYRPVCGDRGGELRSYSNGCSACSDTAVSRHRSGACDS